MTFVTGLQAGRHLISSSTGSPHAEVIHNWRKLIGSASPTFIVDTEVTVPTVLRINGYRFFFYSLENREPAHIHSEKGEKTAKFWLSPLKLASNNGFRGHEINRIGPIVDKNTTVFLEAWHEHFDQSEFIRHNRADR